MVKWSQRTITLSNRQRSRRVDLRLLRRIVQALLREIWPDGDFDLALNLVSRSEITRLNETFLQHTGSTDVITFDYSERAGMAGRRSIADQRLRPARKTPTAGPALLHGEICICVEEAVSQAPQFRVTWQTELVRYAVHGVLHLLGYDDQDAQHRRRMKEAEDTLVRQLACQFHFHSLRLSSAAH
jgi:probable rRNA maturation factor